MVEKISYVENLVKPFTKTLTGEFFMLIGMCTKTLTELFFEE